MLPEVLLAAFIFFHNGPAPAPAPLDGDWTGHITGSAASFDVGVTVIAGGSAVVHYAAPYNCDGTWHELSHEGNVYTYRETILYQYFLGQTCPDGNTIVMTLNPANSTVQYSATTSHSSSPATGQLENVTASDPPGWNAPP